MRRILRLLACCSLACALIPLTPAAAGAATCVPGDGLNVICGPAGSEDLAIIPHTHWMIASGLNVGVPAHLYLIDATAKSAAVLFPLPGEPTSDLTPMPGCPGPPDLTKMSLDGLALRPGRGGVHTLYATNHGDRMAVEFFSVDAHGALPVLHWSGCAPLPAGTLPNAVTTLPDGGLLVISFYDPTDPTAWQEMAARKPTGRILQWHPGRGFEEVADAATSGGNGIETSADGTLIYASSWASSELVILSRKDGSRHALPLGFMPDNIHRLEDGSLLIAGQRGSVAAIAACQGPTCPQPWVVARVEPRSGAIEPLMTGPGSATVSYACGAVALHGTVYVTVRGDQRLVYQSFREHAYLSH